MSRITNSNYNHISVKTDSMVKMLEQLSKLGVLKSKRKSKPRRSKIVDEIKQESDMVGYVKPIEGGQFGLRSPITQNQLEDIQRRNEATIARLSGEVQQQRLADIEAQQGQRFADITKLGGIINPLLERFRSAQDPGAGAYDPFMIPDVQEERFTETLNEGGPEAVEEPQSGEIYAGEEEEVGIPIKQEDIPIGGGGLPFQPVQPIFKAPSKYATPEIKKRAERGISLGLGPPPQARNTSEEKMAYYFQLAAREDFEPKSLKNAKQYLDAINAYLDDDRNFLSA